MCTAICRRGRRMIFGRTLDVSEEYGQGVIATGRRAPLSFTSGYRTENHNAFLGMGILSDSKALYFDAVNEKGLCAAALSFPHYAKYYPAADAKRALASFEIIPYVLSVCGTVSEAKHMLENTTVTDTKFSDSLPPSPLHWMIADKESSIVIESTKKGTEIFDNPFGVLTNSPNFLYHKTHICDFLSLSNSNPQTILYKFEDFSFFSDGYGARLLPGDFSSSSRFVRGAFASRFTSYGESEDDEINSFFHVMETVSIPKGCVTDSEGKEKYTLYTSAMDAEKKLYRFHTYERRDIAVFSLDEYADTDRILKIE